MDIKVPSTDEDGPGAEYFAADDVIRRRVKAMQVLLWFLMPLGASIAGLTLWALVFFAFQIRSWDDACLYVVGLLAGGMAAFGCVWPLYQLWRAGRTTLQALPLYQPRGIVLTEGAISRFSRRCCRKAKCSTTLIKARSSPASRGARSATSPSAMSRSAAASRAPI